MTAVLLFRTRTTPGGTLFSTTPGGTRIIYDREFMLQCRNSPLSRTPPAELEKMLKAVHPEVNHSPHRPEIQTTGNHENGPLKGKCTDILSTTESSQFVVKQLGVHPVGNGMMTYIRYAKYCPSEFRCYVEPSVETHIF